MAASSSLKVLGLKFSAYVARVLMVLNLKAIPYDFVQEDLQNKSALLLQSNPVHKKIPVLIHNDKPVCESVIILQYIEETWSSSPYALLPSDPYDRALARFWAAFIDDKLLDSFKKIFTNPNKEAQAQGAEEAKVNVAFLEGALKSVGKGKTYFGGDKVGLVDVVFASLYGVIKATESLGEVSLINQQTAPALSSLLKALEENDGVKDFLPDPVFITEFFRQRFHSQA